MGENNKVTWGLIVGLTLSIISITLLTFYDKPVHPVLSAIAGGCAVGLGAIMTAGGASIADIFRNVLKSHSDGRTEATVTVTKEEDKKDGGEDAVR